MYISIELAFVESSLCCVREPDTGSSTAITARLHDHAWESSPPSLASNPAEYSQRDAATYTLKAIVVVGQLKVRVLCML